MYKTLLLLLFSVMVLAKGWVFPGISECGMVTTYINNCEAYKVTPPDRNQKCRADNIYLPPNLSFYIKTTGNFEFMEVAISTRPSVPATILKIEKYMFGDGLTWHHTELTKEKHANDYIHSVYVDGVLKKTNSSTDDSTEVTLYFKGFPSYARDCNPDSDELLRESFHPKLPAPQASTEPPKENSTVDEAPEDEEKKYSLVFIISVSAGMAVAVLLIIIAALCYVFHKRLSSKGSEAQDAQENETEAIRFHNSRQFPSPPKHLPPNPMEDDPEKHIYWEVSDFGPVTSVGAGGCDNRRDSARESVNSLYATFDYNTEDDPKNYL